MLTLKNANTSIDTKLQEIEDKKQDTVKLEEDIENFGKEIEKNKGRGIK